MLKDSGNGVTKKGDPEISLISVPDKVRELLYIALIEVPDQA